IYTKAKVTQKIYDQNGVLYRVITRTLNKQGRESRMEYSDKPGVYTDYEYDAQGFQFKTYSESGPDISISQNYYSNGNLDSTRYYKNGALTLTNVYTYYTDKENVLLSSTNGIPFYGGDKKNLMKSMTHVAVNGTITPEEYSYEFDATGRVTALKEVSPNGASAVNYTYY
ncbi:MAG TPA: hypothetical protein VGO58_17630, partial [Chitinophagaceae bacterium]|nr:hypothetical protein [Chitinophagaceae bacterium]